MVIPFKLNLFSEIAIRYTRAKSLTRDTLWTATQVIYASRLSSAKFSACENHFPEL